MALTQEQINKWVEKQIQMEIAAIPGTSVEVALEPTLDAQIKEKQNEINALYKNHSHLTRAEYQAAMNPLEASLQALKKENNAINTRNNAKLVAAKANDTTQADIAKVQKSKTKYLETIITTVKADIAAITEKK